MLCEVILRKGRRKHGQEQAVELQNLIFVANLAFVCDDPCCHIRQMIVETVSSEAAAVHACSTGTWTHKLLGTRAQTRIADSNVVMQCLLEHDQRRTAAQGSPGQPVVQPTGEHSQRLSVRKISMASTAQQRLCDVCEPLHFGHGEPADSVDDM